MRLETRPSLRNPEASPLAVRGQALTGRGEPEVREAPAVEAEARAVSSSLDLTENAQKEAPFEGAELDFEARIRGESLLGDAQSAEEVLSWEDTKKAAKKAKDAVGDFFEPIDPCEQGEDNLRYKAARCGTGRELDKSTRPINYLDSSPSELRAVIQSRQLNSEQRALATLAYASKINLLPQTTSQRLMQHPYVQNAEQASSSQRNDFQRQLSAAFQPSQAMFDRLSGTLGAFATEAVTNTNRNVDQGMKAAGDAVDRGYPTFQELQTILQAGDIEPLKMISQAVKEAGYGQLEPLYQQYRNQPGAILGLTILDAAATSAVDIKVPTNLIDLAGNYGKFVKSSSLRALIGVAGAASKKGGSASPLVLEPVHRSALRALAERVTKHPSNIFEKDAFGLRWSFQHRVDKVMNGVKTGRLSKADAKQQVRALQGQFTHQFQKLSTSTHASNLLVGKFLLSSPVWTTWDL